MSAIRSSVRPKSSKQNWGTIIKPEFGLGYQRLTNYEIQQTVERLYKVKTEDGRTYDQPSKSMSEKEILQMLERLTKEKKDRIPDSDRRVTSSIYRDMGVVASYAWKGYN
ncbi:uncharacterized protein LOC121378893 [Gigantopelta aegis]|uniref:uncharacterized protein LOC121378893 n=1 Tax=Gigantopelta aegis TaxID=1735272 RepID=UPI001B889CF0|nr:uncharacterized protein LOC121378893 [Gigantopelta aegis]